MGRPLPFLPRPAESSKDRGYCPLNLRFFLCDVSFAVARTAYREGRCPDRPGTEVTGLRPQEPHPLHQSVSPADVPHDERDGTAIICQLTIAVRHGNILLR